MVLGPCLLVEDFFDFGNLIHLFEVLFHSQAFFVLLQRSLIFFHSVAVGHDLIRKVALNNHHLFVRPEPVLEFSGRFLVPLLKEFLSVLLNIDSLELVLDLLDRG